jgi:hypothetical protein
MEELTPPSTTGVSATGRFADIQRYPIQPTRNTTATAAAPTIGRTRQWPAYLSFCVYLRVDRLERPRNVVLAKCTKGVIFRLHPYGALQKNFQYMHVALVDPGEEVKHDLPGWLIGIDQVIQPLSHLCSHQFRNVALVKVISEDALQLMKLVWC